MVISRLDYCNSLLASLQTCVIQQLQLIQNAAARLVFNLPKFSHVTPLLWSLHWLQVAARIRFNVLTLANAAANKTDLHYLQDIIQAYTLARPLRSAATGCLDPSCQPCNCLSLVQTAELLHPCSPVVEQSPHLHKNYSLPAHLLPQLEDSPLHSVPRLLFGSFLIYCPFSYILAPVSSYLALINYICLGMVLYGLTWPIQLVYLIYIHDLSTKSM